jgi:hypothetical protein
LKFYHKFFLILAFGLGHSHILFGFVSWSVVLTVVMQVKRKASLAWISFGL